MESAIDIRTARRKDAATIQLLLEELAASTGKPGGIQSGVAEIEYFGFGKTRFFEALIASQAKVDVGLLLYFPEYSSWRGRPGIYVQDLYVVESARCGGVARSLLGEAARRTEAMGGCYIRLAADTDNLSAQEFYLMAGFRAAEDERLFVLEGEDFAGFAGS
jgi:ribosomal protein S18 acetylase RimI-like enzyme